MDSVTVYSISPIIDELYRYRKSENSEADIIYLGDTSSVESKIKRSFLFGVRNLLQEKDILTKITGNLWKTHRYNQEYISYLLGNYTEEEFMTIANEFAEPLQNDISNDDLVVASKVVFTVIKQTLTSADLSILLNVDSAVIDSKMPVLGYISDDSESE